jgi:HPt (histidine-containing phosphotransfer) domain-containing protein
LFTGPGQDAAMSGPIDVAHLQRMTHGDHALAREVLHLFEAQVARHLHAIETAIDARGRREAAHALKGAARGVGAFAVADAAEKLERLEAPGIAPTLSELRAHVAEVRQAIPLLTAD